jgi:hypothetical protein
MLERDLQTKIADYLRLQYPKAIFHSDYGSGVKLTVRQATIQKRQNGGIRGWPDMFIAEPAPRCIDGSWDYEWHGLFIELKKEGTRLKKKDGTWASDHIAEQAKMMVELEKRGYLAKFAVGFEEAKDIIDKYLQHFDIAL